MRCDTMCINEQRSVCSVLSVVHVHVRDSVYVVHRVWLKVDVVVAIIYAVILRNWTDIEPEDYSPIAYTLSKQLRTLLSHGQLLREEDGAIEFWIIKDYLRNDFVRSQHWSDEMWKSTMARGGGNKKRFQNCTDPSGQEFLYLRALQGHSGRHPIDPSLQDNMLIPNDFFEYISHRMCDQFALHHEFRIDTRRTNIEQKTDGIFCVWILWTRNTEIRITLNWKHHVLHGTSRKSGRNIKKTVYWVDIKLAQKKGFKFYQTRSIAIILYDTLPACCIPKAIMTGTGEIILEKVYASLRLPPKISFKDIWMKELGSEVAGNSKETQRIQPKTKNPIVRTGRLVLAEQPFGSHAQEINKRVLLACESTNVRTGRRVSSCVPVSVERLDQDKDGDEKVDADQVRTGRPVESEQSIVLFTQREEIDIVFRVSGLPHAVETSVFANS